MSEPKLSNTANGSEFPPKNTEPLSPGRTDLNPSDEPGVDELPNDELDTPEDDSSNSYSEGVPDTDPDNAEMDNQPNPR